MDDPVGQEELQRVQQQNKQEVSAVIDNNIQILQYLSRWHWRVNTPHLPHCNSLFSAVFKLVLDARNGLAPMPGLTQYLLTNLPKPWPEAKPLSSQSELTKDFQDKREILEDIFVASKRLITATLNFDNNCYFTWLSLAKSSNSILTEITTYMYDNKNEKQAE
uniref:DZF domain-containing protein n=1 Tax=Meloidogyne hapla TaxID=6305 RepID=A0A1I8B4P0_MELHA